MKFPPSFPHKYAAATVAAALALLAAPSAFAAELGPDGQPIVKDSAESANRYLGNVYKDEASGFKFAPPAGSATITRAGGNDLVKFVNKEKQTGGAVQSITLDKKTSVEDYMRSSVAEMTKTIRAVQVIESKKFQFGGRPAGKLVTTMETEVDAGRAPAGRAGRPVKQMLAIYRQDLIVQVAPNQFLVLNYFTNLRDRVEASATFNAMIESFEVFDKEQVAKRRVLAVEAGKKWLAQRTAEELKAKLIPDQLFRIKVAGKDVGFVLFKELEVQQAESRGIRIGVISKTWLADGRVVDGKNKAFWAYSRDAKGNQRPDYSEWENASATLVKRADLPNGQYTFWVTEAGTLSEVGGSPIDAATREQLRREREELLRHKVLPPDRMPPPIKESLKASHLVVTFSGDPTQDFHENNKGINVVIPDFRPAVLPKILEYSWPRLVDLTKPGEMTFAVYNSASRKMTLRTLTVHGPTRERIAGKAVDCIKCTDEMDNAGTTLWVDNTGRILKMLTSDQSLMEPTTIGTMQELWGNKLGLFDPK